MSCALLLTTSDYAQALRALHALLTLGLLQLELSRNRCRDKRIDVWPRAVDTAVFNPAFRCEAMRQRMTDGHTHATVLVYVGRLGAGLILLRSSLISLIINSCLSATPFAQRWLCVCSFCLWPFQPFYLACQPKAQQTFAAQCTPDVLHVITFDSSVRSTACITVCDASVIPALQVHC